MFPNQQKRFTLIRLSQEFANATQEAPEMALGGGDIRLGNGTTIAGPTVILSDDDDTEMRRRLKEFAKEAESKGEHLAIVIRDFVEVDGHICTIGKSFFLDTKKILAAEGAPL